MRKLLALPAILLLAGCGSEKDERGLELMPDMYHTPAVESQGAGTTEVEARDAQGNPIRRQVHHPAMLAPPAGTVPREGRPYDLAPGDWAAARVLPNPMPALPAVLKTGQRDYLSFCAPCHGRDGEAGTAAMASYFGGIPSLNGMAVLQYPEGEIFHIITHGKGRMTQMSAQLPIERRWGVVHFLKLQARATVAAEDVAKLVPYIEAEIAKHPGDQALIARRAEILALAAQAKADLDALGAAGDGHDFAPAPEPVPEYVVPRYPRPEDGP